MGIYLEKFFHTQTGKIIMSLLLGLGLASLFRKVCTNKNCLIYHAPPLDKIQNKIYKSSNIKGKCITYKPIQTKCSINSKIIEFD